MASTSFRKLGERPAYASSLLNITVATLEGPDGRQFERDVLRHPGAVVVVPFDQGTGEVVFVRQYRAPLDAELLEVPAGTRDVHEEPTEDTAARELAEEVGLRAGRLELIGRFYSTPGFSDEELWCFLARDLSPVPLSPHGAEEEHMTIERHPLSELPALVRSGRLKDAKSIVSLYLAQLCLAEEP